MRYTACMVGRSETLPIEQFHSLKLYHQLTVELNEHDNIVQVVERLHGECKEMLEAQKGQQGLPATPVVVETKTEFVTADELACNGGGCEDNGDNGSKPHRNGRSVKALIDEHDIRALKYANYLRATEQITYPEWRRLSAHFGSEGH